MPDDDLLSEAYARVRARYNEEELGKLNTAELAELVRTEAARLKAERRDNTEPPG